MGVLRFFLALSVIFTHAGSFSGFFLGDGRLAVQAFYMISGFYMSMVWTEKYSNYPSPIRTFYVSRALRIYPLYFLVLVGTLALSAFIAIPPIEYFKQSSGGMLATFWVYLTQLTLIGMETSVFYGLSGYWLSPVAWSLGLELTFYLLVPFLMPRFKLALALLVASLAARYVTCKYMGWSSTTPDYALMWSYRFFPFEIALFILGAFSYKFFARFEQLLSPFINRPETTFIILMSLVSWLCYFSLLYPVLGESAYWIYYAIVFLSLWVLFQNTKKSRFDSYIGELSFPLYIIHIPLLWMISLYVKPVNAIYVAIPLAVFASIALAMLQSGIDRYRHSIKVSASTTPQAARTLTAA